MSNTSISIIIPAYNVGQWINECIASIAKQNWPYIECIIIDDNSTDNTLEEVKISITSYIAGGSSVQFKIIHHDSNKGVSAARNTGLKVATGDYVWFVDPDDYIEKDAVCNLLQKIDNYKPDIIFFSHTAFYDSYRNKVYNHYPIARQKSYIDILLATYSSGGSSLALWNRIILRETLISNNLWFDETLVTGEDQDLQIRMADLHNLSIDFNSHCCYFKRNGRKGAFSSSNRRAMTGSLGLVKKYILRMDDSDSNKKELFRNCIATWINNAILLIAKHQALDRNEAILFIDENREKYSILLIESFSEQYQKLGRVLRHSVAAAIFMKRVDLSFFSRALRFIKNHL